jgi:uncharacterized protein (TIGR00730 family)
MKTVCVYCASSPNIRDVYFDATRKLAGYLVDENIEVVFGGGSVGLMGQLADTVLEKGGTITGIMPNFMKLVEWDHKGVKDFHFTETMAQRKQKFLDLSDGLITLAGGCGTFEELLEAITLKRLGIFNKPIVILNTDGYYDPLEQMLERSISERFLTEAHRDMWTFVREPEEVIPALRGQKVWKVS